jgi:hypothetical protein
MMPKASTMSLFPMMMSSRAVASTKGSALFHNTSFWARQTRDLPIKLPAARGNLRSQRWATSKHSFKGMPKTSAKPQGVRKVLKKYKKQGAV